jgi:tol-pal system protein YbgF
MSRRLIVPFLLLLVMALPAHAQRVSTSDRLTALEQRLATMGAANVDQLNQIAELKRELSELRSQNEELQRKLEQVGNSSRIEIGDLDDRVTRLETQATAPATATPPAGASAPAGPAARPAAPAPARPTVTDTPPRVYGDAATLGKGADERAAYNAAFDVLKAGRYPEAAAAFLAFLGQYPEGTYTPNAVYWLGESYYAAQQYALAQAEFQRLVSRYPTHDKAPGALLKVGLCQQSLRQLDAAEATYREVASRYPGTEPARTAEDRIRAVQLMRVR